VIRLRVACKDATYGTLLREPRRALHACIADAWAADARFGVIGA
jgi:hypothetical protein